MTADELQIQLESERELANRLLEEKADTLLALQAMAEAARCIAESFRMTLAAHNLSMRGHQKAFARYNRAKRQYDELRGVKVYRFAGAPTYNEGSRNPLSLSMVSGAEPSK
jgi:hypothetical protein